MINPIYVDKQFLNNLAFGGSEGSVQPRGAAESLR